MPKIPDLATAKAKVASAEARVTSAKTTLAMRGPEAKAFEKAELAEAEHALREAKSVLSDAEQNHQLQQHNERVAADRERQRQDNLTREAIDARKRADEWLARPAKLGDVPKPTHPAALERIAEVEAQRQREQTAAAERAKDPGTVARLAESDRQRQAAAERKAEEQEKRGPSEL
jgi:hypothetical protein